MEQGGGAMALRMRDDSTMSISEQAAERFLRLQCGDVSIQERADYLQWLKRSPVHVAESLYMRRINVGLAKAQLQWRMTNTDSPPNVVALPGGQRHCPPFRSRFTDPFEQALERAARTYPVDSATLVRRAREQLAKRRLWRWKQRIRRFIHGC
jgi:hypothetical protein